MHVLRPTRDGLSIRGACLLVVIAVATGCIAVACGGTGTSAQGTPVVLIVGDSLVAAAATDLTGLSPTRAHTVVLAGIGASPCDLWAGYRASPPFGAGFLSFRAAVLTRRPSAVVLAFTGNPGVSVHACITRPTADYSLSEILSTYRRSLKAMGVFASGRGARVFLSASPARNPSVPEGWVGQTQEGYNGDPAFNAMMSGLASSEGWTYETAAAAAISGPGLGWTTYLPCQPAKGIACIDGRQQVRYGGPDAIHCDAPGSNGIGAPSDGSLRFANGLLTPPLAALGLKPMAEAGSASTTVPRNTCTGPKATTS